MNDRNESVSSDYKPKELVYNLLNELTSEIIGCKIDINEEDYEDTIRNINFSELISYVRKSIQILLKKKTDKEKTFEISLAKGKIKEISSKLSQYESILKKNEEKQRGYISSYFQNINQKDLMESKISKYNDMKNEFEEMKTILKCEDGKCVINERKENEIVFIRNENTKLKEAIDKLNKKIKSYDKVILEKENKINSVKKANVALEKKLAVKQKEVNLFSNNNININNDNNLNIQEDNIQMENSERSEFIFNKIQKRKIEKKKDLKFSKSERTTKVQIPHFHKIFPNLLRKKNYISQITHRSLLNTGNVTQQESQEKTSSRDYIDKYFRSKHIKSNSQQLNQSSNKIRKASLGNTVSYKNNNNISYKSHVPSFNQGNNSLRSYNSFNQLIYRSCCSRENSNKKMSQKSSVSYRMGNVQKKRKN